jgi:hypothetical protein
MHVADAVAKGQGGLRAVWPRAWATALAAVRLQRAAARSSGGRGLSRTWRGFAARGGAFNGWRG